MTDPISDMLTRIRNALMAQKKEVMIPYSEIKFNIVKLLEKNSWLAGVTILDQFNNLTRKKKSWPKFGQIVCRLIYDENNQSRIRELRRVSKPGNRVYVKQDQIPYVYDGYGLAIISTSQGLLTDREAREKGVGGEILCEIW